MSSRRQDTPADFKERMIQYMVALLLLLSILFTTSALTYVVSSSAMPVLELLEKLLALVILIASLSLAYLLTRHRTARNELRTLSEDSFLFDVVKKSFSISWVVTFIVITALKLYLDDYLDQLPIEFLLDIARLTMLGSFCVCFLLQNRNVGFDDEIEGSGSG